MDMKNTNIRHVLNKALRLFHDNYDSVKKKPNPLKEQLVPYEDFVEVLDQVQKYTRQFHDHKPLNDEYKEVLDKFELFAEENIEPKMPPPPGSGFYAILSPEIP